MSLLAIANEKDYWLMNGRPWCHQTANVFYAFSYSYSIGSLGHDHRALTATLAHGQLGPRRLKKRNFTTGKRWEMLPFASTVWRRWLPCSLSGDGGYLAVGGVIRGETFILREPRLAPEAEGFSSATRALELRSPSGGLGRGLVRDRDRCPAHIETRRAIRADH